MLMKKALLFSTSLILLITFTGCKSITMSRHEIRDLEFIRAIAIDKSLSEEGYVRLTISSQRVSSKGDGQSEEKESITVYSEGRTVSEAMRNFNKYLEKEPFLGHLEYIVIGEEAARDGILKYIDFFSRDHEVRLNMNVFLMKSGRAEELMEKASSKGKFIFDKLGGLIKNRTEHSMTNIVNLIEVMYILDLEFLNLYIPCIEMVKVTKNENGPNSSMDVKMSGLAIFERDKLVGHLDDSMARGLNWLMDKIYSGIIVVNSQKGSKISLEIVDSKTKIQPEIKDDNLFVKVKVNVFSNIDEIQSSENIFNGETISFLERQQGQIVKEEIEKVIEYAQQEVGLDFFGIGGKFFHKYPIVWEDIYRKKWRAVFPEVKFEVTVNSSIRKTYDIKQPNALGDGEFY